MLAITIAAGFVAGYVACWNGLPGYLHNRYVALVMAAGRIGDRARSTGQSGFMWWCLAAPLLFVDIVVLHPRKGGMRLWREILMAFRQPPAE
ncbi:hypothetical protein ABR737_01500 [Streptomyces sp. Edi2]|uniref:hypothetical protein n=1 Tax=Streptomyces sp. Edi2 TaxID=3162528 RepID=UPI0033067E37